MKKGAYIYASMMGTRADWVYNSSTEFEDGIRRVNISTQRLKVNNMFINFTENEKDLLSKFPMFKKIHVGYYDAQYREDEGSDFHYTFIGQKV